MFRDWWQAFILPAMLGGSLVVAGAVSFFRDGGKSEVSSPWPLRLLCLGAGLCLPVLIYLSAAFSKWKGETSSLRSDCSPHELPMSRLTQIAGSMGRIMNLDRKRFAAMLRRGLEQVLNSASNTWSFTIRRVRLRSPPDEARSRVPSPRPGGALGSCI
jgi:hypothetical protein